MSVLNELKRFQTERMLHKKPFNKVVATMNILEELLEMWGVGDNKNRTLVKTLMVPFRIVVAVAEIPRKWNRTFKLPTVEEMIDALCDIQVFAGGDVLKLGYDNEECLSEVAKEINSRTGEIIEGKFQKYKTQEAKALWYKATFKNCKLDS